MVQTFLEFIHLQCTGDAADLREVWSRSQCVSGGCLNKIFIFGEIETMRWVEEDMETLTPHNTRQRGLLHARQVLTVDNDSVECGVFSLKPW